MIWFSVMTTLKLHGLQHGASKGLSLGSWNPAAREWPRVSWEYKQMAIARSGGDLDGVESSGTT